MEIEKLIEAAITGGWTAFDTMRSPHVIDMPNLNRCGDCFCANKEAHTHLRLEKMHHEILLDPLMWQSAGKELGWKEKYKHLIDNKLRPALRCSLCNGKPMVGSGHCSWSIEDEWRTRQHRFLDALQEGKTLSEAVSEATT